MEGDNPAGSVKDRAALSMLKRAEERGDIKPGDTLIEATSGNTGIALAMVAAVRGYKMVLLMPDNLSIERRQSMAAYGAQIVLTPKTGGMEYARDMAEQMQREGKGIILDQFGNGDNPRAHYETTGPEIWRDTAGRVTHFVSAMGTTGTIMGVSQYLKEQNEAVRIVGAQPEEGSSIPGIRKWPEAYRDAEKIKGEGDAKASEIYAQSFGKNPEFYKFYRSLEAYRATFKNHGDVMVLDSGSEFFKYFRSPGAGGAAPAAPSKK
jgi:cysteine synthase B